MRIVWTNAARRDLVAHFDYLALRNSEAALHLDDAVRQAVERLTDHPHRGRPAGGKARANW